MTVTIDGTSGITYPAGTIQGTGYGPAFSAYANAATSLTGGVSTKLTLGTETFDTANCFASSRFTPNVAGYYQINGAVRTDSTSSYFTAYLFKNGNVLNGGSFSAASVAAFQSSVSSVVYMNGSTDYIELYAYSSTTVNSTTGEAATYFNGAMIRGA